MLRNMIRVLKSSLLNIQLKKLSQTEKENEVDVLLAESTHAMKILKDRLLLIYGNGKILN